MYRKRLVEMRLKNLLRQFPVIAIIGARQIGKSMLAAHGLGQGYERFDLEDPADLARIHGDPAFALEGSRKVLIDEVQREPALFSFLRSHVDRHPGRKIVLLGSASPALIRGVSESLTGRVAFLELTGVSVLEEPDWQKLWILGQFPRLHWGKPRPKSGEWYSAYLRTYLEQDIPQLGFRISALKLRNLLTMVAHGQGGLCNLSELGASLGMNYHSVAHLLDIFEGTFAIRRLPPYFANIGKRLVKSPKIYVRDTGLLHQLLSIPHTEKSLRAHPKAGASFETFCIEQILGWAKLRDPAAEAFFFRTHGGAEVDLLLNFRGRLLPVEIKLNASANVTRGLEVCMKDLGLKRGYVVNPRDGIVALRPGIVACGLRDFLATLK